MVLQNKLEKYLDLSSEMKIIWYQKPVRILKMAVFWFVAPCSLVISEVLAASIIIIALMMEAASTSETSVN
jgi:hypothetical protein